MKKFLSFLLTFVMLFSLAMPAMAAEETYTFYIDIGQVADSEKEVAGVWLWDYNSEVYNTQMTHVSGSVYSYPVTSSTPDGCCSINYTDDTWSADYLFESTDAGMNLYTPTGQYEGTWSTYGSAGGSTGGPTVNGNTTGDVTASYTPTATITGVSITVDGTEYTSGHVTITPDSTVTLTVYGTNLQNGTADNLVSYASGYGIFVAAGYSWEFHEDYATQTISASEFVNSSDYEIFYYNNYNAGPDNHTEVYTGIYVTYDDGTTEPDTPTIPNPLYFKAEGETTVDVFTYNSSGATIEDADGKFMFNMTAVEGEDGVFSIDTSVFPKGTAKVYFSGSIVSTKTLDIPTDGSNMYDYDAGEWTTYVATYTVTVNTSKNGTVTADKLTAVAGETVTLTVDPDAMYKLGTITVTDATGVPVTVTDKTFVMPASDVTVTATFEELPITSVAITWGSMEFTYDDTVAEGATEENGWTCEAGANNIVVENTGETTFTAQAAYASYEGYESITGSFDPASKELAIGEKYTFTLELNGKPTKVLKGDKIGKVTITINESAEG